jgi:hypothetical protein
VAAALTRRASRAAGATRTRVLLVPLAAASIAAPARADPARDVLSEMAKCAEVAEASERLKCFDAGAVRAKSLLAAPAPAPEAAAKKSWLDWFGFSRPEKPATTKEEFGKPPQPAESGELREITATVVEFAKTGRGKAVFILDNGQVWRQLDADGTEVPYAPASTPMKVTIETGFLGSYNLVIEGRNGLIKVTRLK